MREQVQIRSQARINANRYVLPQLPHE